MTFGQAYLQSKGTGWVSFGDAQKVRQTSGQIIYPVALNVGLPKRAISGDSTAVVVVDTPASVISAVPTVQDEAGKTNNDEKTLTDPRKSSKMGNSKKSGVGLSSKLSQKIKFLYKRDKGYYSSPRVEQIFESASDMDFDVVVRVIRNIMKQEKSQVIPVNNSVLARFIRLFLTKVGNYRC